MEAPLPTRLLIYQSLFSFVRDMISADSLGITRRLIFKLSTHYDTMSGKDTISAIVRSPESRKALIQLAAELKIDSEAAFRVALREDEQRLGEYILQILNIESQRAVLFVLKPDSGQIFMDVVQSTIDKGFILDKKDQAEARKLVMKLSAEYDKLPSGLSIAGPVTGRDEHATAHGGFGDIYRAVYAGKAVALKCMRTNLRGDDLRQIRRKFCQEALVWQRLQHRFILPLIGIDAETFSPFPCMVSPWMDHGTVLDYLSGYGRGNVDKFLCEIAQGLQYLHAQKIVHGDLRGANILVTQDWSACLADFGLAQFSEITNTVSSLNRAGSLRWMAPELLDPRDFGLRFVRTIASDIYAFGCVCLELYTGSPPFTGLSDGAVIREVVAGGRPEQPAGQKTMSDVLWRHTTHYWTQNPSARPATGALVEDMIALMTADTQLRSRTMYTSEHQPSTARSPDDVLIQLASRIGFKDNEGLRNGLQKDYERILARIVGVVQSPEASQAVLKLTGDDAQDFVDDLHSIHRDLPDTLRLAARQTLLRLSEVSNTFPSSIFIPGSVLDWEEQPSFRSGFADIYRATYRDKPVAAKRIRSFVASKSEPKIRLAFIREALVWQSLNSPYVVPLIGIDRETMSMVSPWMALGSALKYLAQSGRESVDKLLSEIAQGLLYLHSQNIVHGDLRGANILITHDRIACLADFGLSSFHDRLQSDSTSTSVAGSIRWMAPELIHPESFGCPKFKRTTASDVYAYACVCLELHTGRPPFSGLSSDAAVMLRVVSGERPARPDTSMSDDLWALVTTAWAQNFSDRPSMKTISGIMCAAAGLPKHS